jgi:hypothetical protein
VADYSRGGSKTVWPSGLRRWLQAPVRKGVGSNPTAVIAGAQMPEQPPCRRRRRASSECACPRRPARASRPRSLEASRHRGDESAACPQKRPPWGSSPRPRGRGPCALLTELSVLLAILDVVVIIYHSRCGAISETDRANCNRGRIRPRRKTHCWSRAGGKCGGRQRGTPEQHSSGDARGGCGIPPSEGGGFVAVAPGQNECGRQYKI